MTRARVHKRDGAWWVRIGYGRFGPYPTLADAHQHARDFLRTLGDEAP